MSLTIIHWGMSTIMAFPVNDQGTRQRVCLISLHDCAQNLHTQTLQLLNNMIYGKARYRSKAS